jgi:lambda family phage portal protein
MKNPLAWMREKFGGTVSDAGMPALAEVIDLETRRPRTAIGASAGFGGPWGGSYAYSGEKYRDGLPTSGMSPYIDHRTAMINAREQYHVSSVGRALVERFTQIVVDAGLKLEPTPAAEVLGITREEASAWGRTVANRFHLWANSKWAHTPEQMSFYQIQRQVETFQQRDGEYFVRLNYDDSPGRPSPLSISLIEQEQIGGCAYTSTQGYQFDVDGIERDAHGREISYSVSVKRGNVWRVEKIPASLPNGRRIMIHGWCPEYASQTRGFSPLTHAIQELEQITTFSIAELNKAIAQSSFIGAKETDAGSIPTGSIFGDASSNFAVEDGGEGAPESRAFGFEPQRVGLAPGSIFLAEGLAAGEKIKGFQNTSPVASFEQFVNAIVCHLSAARSMPVEVLLQKFNANYSASRAALVMAWRTANIWRKELETDFLNVVYETWLSEEIAAGRITARGWSDPIMRLAWLSCEWPGSPMPNIDPEKSVKASRLAIESNLTNYEREASDYNNSDAETNKAINAAFSKGMKKAPWKGGNDPAPLNASPRPVGEGNIERTNDANEDASDEPADEEN